MSKKGRNRSTPEGLPRGFRAFHEAHGFPDELDAYEELLDERPSTFIRLNPDKFPDTPEGEPLPWCLQAYRLPERPRFDEDPLFHVGSYYVQEGSSTVIGELAKQLIASEKAPERAHSEEKAPPLKVLDLCAAPGGKSTHLASVMPRASLLVANEAIGKRIPVLNEQIRKWGNPNVVVTNADPERFGEKLPESFDLVLVDAPCSGEGLFRKMPEHRAAWGPGMVEHSAMRQRRILENAWRTLKEGGTLIYCTCTLNRKENEEVLKPLIDQRRALSLPASEIQLSGWQRTDLDGVTGYRSWPQHTGGEGFFFALLRKERGDGEGAGPLEKALSKKKKKGGSEAPKGGRELLSEPERWSWLQKDEAHYVLESSLLEPFRQLEARVPVKWPGTWTANSKGQELLPAPDLALSPILNPNAYPIKDLDRATALYFLARQPLDANELPKGWCLLSYKDVPLGWAKNLGDRVNGQFPKRWRVV